MYVLYLYFLVNNIVIDNCRGKERDINADIRNVIIYIGRWSFIYFLFYWIKYDEKYYEFYWTILLFIFNFFLCAKLLLFICCVGYIVIVWIKDLNTITWVGEYCVVRPPPYRDKCVREKKKEKIFLFVWNLRSWKLLFYS